MIIVSSIDISNVDVLCLRRFDMLLLARRRGSPGTLPCRLSLVHVVRGQSSRSDILDCHAIRPEYNEKGLTQNIKPTLSWHPRHDRDTHDSLSGAMSPASC